jgi:hypothetical protein
LGSRITRRKTKKEKQGLGEKIRRAKKKRSMSGKKIQNKKN